MDTTVDVLPLNQHLLFFSDTLGTLQLGDLRDESFKPLASEHFYLNEFPAAKAFWMKVEIANPYSSTFRYVLYFHPGIDTISIYHSQTSRVQHIAALSPLSARPIRVAQELCTYVQFVPGQNTLYLRVSNTSLWSRELASFIANLAKPDVFLNYFLWARHVQGICLGVVGIMIVFHLVIFLFFRDRTFLLFIINIFVTLLYLLILKHYHAEIASAPWLIELLRFIRNPLAVLVCGSTLLFAQSFLSTREKDLLVHRLMSVTIGVSGLIAVLMLVGMKLWLLEQISIYLAVLTFLLVVIASLRSLAKGNPLAWYTFFGFFVFMTSVLLFFFPLSFTDYRANETDFHYYAEAFRAVVFAIGIADRFRRIRLESTRTQLEKKQVLLEQEQKLQREKERISRDLHDNIGSQLTTLKLGLRSSADSRALELPLEEVINQLRNTIWAIEQQNITLNDLATKMRNLVWQHQKAEQAVQVEFLEDVNGQLPLSPTDSVNALRVVQEGLQNGFKHAQATKILIRLISRDQEIVISIEDNGVGFNADQAHQEGHFGIRNMQKRAQEMRARLQISSSPQGTTVKLFFSALTQ